MSRNFRPAAASIALALAAAALGAQSYDPVGPQTGVAVATVVAGGWSPCLTTPYGAETRPYVEIVQNACPGEKLMLACAPVGADTLTLLAQAERDLVLLNPGEGREASHLANGAQWYYGEGTEGNGEGSWGFAVAGEDVYRYPCDSRSTNADTRLCWHIVPIGGYRCGSTLDLQSSSDWAKIVYRSTSSLFADGFEDGDDVCAWAAFQGATVECSRSPNLTLSLGCGATYTDQSADDLSPWTGEVGYRLAWDDLPRETGYRLQVSDGDAWVDEDDWAELPPDLELSPLHLRYWDDAWTYRLIAHVGHPPGHGPTPIDGDVVSEPCTVNVAMN